MPCSWCGADGTNATTCPHNPNRQNNANPAKHNAQPLPGKSSGVAGLATAMATLSIKPKAQTAAKPPSISSAARAEAASAFPHDPERRQEYEADVIRLAMPKVPTKVSAMDTEIANRCAQCLRAIRSRTDKYDSWQAIQTLCADCSGRIGAQYERDRANLSDRPYRQYHRKAKDQKSPSAVALDDLTAHGAKDGYYNGTMYDGAQYWATLAGTRKLQYLPSVPKGGLQ